jgi:ribosomal protein L17
MEKPTRYRTRIGTTLAEALEVRHDVQYIPLLAKLTSVSRRSSSTDTVFQMATTDELF